MNTPDRYLRRCNGQPREGIPISARWLSIVLAGLKDVQRDPGGQISWTSGGRRFTADPVVGAPADESTGALR